MRKKQKNLQQAVCLPYCTYYKPGRNEELACQGFVVVQHLIDIGDISAGISLEKPVHPVPPPDGSESVLREHMCVACPFYEEDCDFILSGGSARPCGGFALLLHLLGTGSITIDYVTKLTDQEQQKER